MSLDKAKLFCLFWKKNQNACFQWKWVAVAGKGEYLADKVLFLAELSWAEDSEDMNTVSGCNLLWWV